MKVFNINLFQYNNFIVFKNKNILKVLILNKLKFIRFDFNLNINDIFIDFFSKNVCINAENNYYYTILIKNLNFLIKKKYISFFFKVKFNGKGFRIQSFKKKRIMNFTFGHSHRYMMYLGNIIYKRINKYKYYYLIKNINLKNYLKNLFKKIKPINKYTLRGLRISRTTIVKRKGRKSPSLEI